MQPPPLSSEVNEAAMQSLLDRLRSSRVLLILLIGGMALVLLSQQRELQRLRDHSAAQVDMLERQQELTARAVQHLELIRKYNVPYRYLEVLADASEELDLELEFMVGLMQVESHFDPNAQSHKNAYGLMQVRYPTALELDPALRSFWQLFEPERNIRLGALYFRKLLDRYDGDYRMAALAYNRGPNRLEGELLIGEVSDRYYRKIMTAGIVD
ncbi:MAG: transglycosylase SLT domain-containing protein [bacterium]